MNVLRWYFGFHRPHAQSLWGRMGHVEAWGFSKDTYVFLELRMTGLHVDVLHDEDDVREALTDRYHRCDLILTIPQPKIERRRLPLHLCTCVGVCSWILGERAFTIGGLRRTLLRKGAEVVKDDTQNPR